MVKIKEPESTDNLVYFTNRFLDNDGQVMCWVEKKECPACHKALMGKPVDEKTGKPKIRAKEYVCPECGHTEPKKDHEESLVACIKYTCPKCSNVGEKEIPFKRKKVKGTDALVFECDKCKEKIYVTKKMKKLKE